MSDFEILSLIIRTAPIFLGLFSLISSIADWDFFFKGHVIYWYTKIITRKGARIFFGLLGIGLIYVGVGQFIKF